MLYVVATPIGNLGDMSPRAVETLQKVALIAAEDTRMTMKLTQHFHIETPLTSCHRHNEFGKAEQIVRRMQEENIDVALVTDAGTPAISDPGTHLVHLAAEANIPVVAVPGPTAMASAMSVSGMDVTEFTFMGFLPREKKDLEEKLLSMRGHHRGAVIHESPYRIRDLVGAVEKTLPEAMLSVSCDLTKLHETTLRGTPSAVLAEFSANEKSEKGEYCVVMDLRACPAAEAPAPGNASMEARILEKMLSGLSLREARESLAAEGEKKNAVYAASLNVRKYMDDIGAEA